MDELEAGGGREGEEKGRDGGGGAGRGLEWEIPSYRPQRRLSVRLGPQAIMVNPHPAGPRTQFPASLIENDGLFLVWVNKTRSHLWKKSILSGFVPEVAAISLCLCAAFQNVLSSLSWLSPSVGRDKYTRCFAVLMPGLFFSESFEVLSAFMEIKPLLNKLFHRLWESST